MWRWLNHLGLTCFPRLLHALHHCDPSSKTKNSNYVWTPYSMMHRILAIIPLLDHDEHILSKFPHRVLFEKTLCTSIVPYLRNPYSNIGFENKKKTSADRCTSSWTTTLVRFPKCSKLVYVISCLTQSCSFPCIVSRRAWHHSECTTSSHAPHVGKLETCCIRYLAVSRNGLCITRARMEQ